MKYLNNQCSAAELSILVVCFSQPENQVFISEYIAENIKIQHTDVQYDQLVNRIVGRVNLKLKQELYPEFFPVMRKLRHIAAVSAFVLKPNYIHLNYVSSTHSKKTAAGL